MLLYHSSSTSSMGLKAQREPKSLEVSTKPVVVVVPVVMMMLLLLGLEFLAQEAEAVFSASGSSIQTRLLFILDIMLFLTEAKLVWVLAREY